MVEGDFKEDELDHNHKQRLRKQAQVILGVRPVKDSAQRESQKVSQCCCRGGGVGSNLRKEATSIMRGMSREKPALLLDRCMEMIWSL